MKLCKSTVTFCKEYCRTLDVDQQQKGLNFIKEIQSMINAWDTWPRDGYLVSKSGLQNNHVTFILGHMGLLNHPNIGCRVTDNNSIKFIKK